MLLCDVLHHLAAVPEPGQRVGASLLLQLLIVEHQLLLCRLHIGAEHGTHNSHKHKGEDHVHNLQYNRCVLSKPIIRLVPPAVNKQHKPHSKQKRRVSDLISHPIVNGKIHQHQHLKHQVLNTAVPAIHQDKDHNPRQLQCHAHHYAGTYLKPVGSEKDQRCQHCKHISDPPSCPWTYQAHYQWKDKKIQSKKQHDIPKEKQDTLGFILMSCFFLE